MGGAMKLVTFICLIALICGQQHDRKELLACCLLGRGLTSQPCPNDACKWICGTDGCTATPTAFGARSASFNSRLGQPVPSFTSFQQPTATAFNVPSLNQWGLNSFQASQFAPVSQTQAAPQTSFLAPQPAVAAVTQAPATTPTGDKHKYCCFWAKQNKCSDPQTKTFMDATCPESCQKSECNKALANAAPVPNAAVVNTASVTPNAPQGSQQAINQAQAYAQSLGFNTGATQAQLKLYQQQQLQNYHKSIASSLDEATKPKFGPGAAVSAAQQTQVGTAQVSDSAPQANPWGAPQQPTFQPQAGLPAAVPGFSQQPSAVAGAAAPPTFASPGANVGSGGDIVQPTLPESQLKQFCCYWSSQNQCSANPAWMLVHCKKECEDPSCASSDGNPQGFDPTGKNQAKLYAKVKEGQRAAIEYTQSLNKRNDALHQASAELLRGAQQQAAGGQPQYTAAQVAAYQAQVAAYQAQQAAQPPPQAQKPYAAPAAAAAPAQAYQDPRYSQYTYEQNVAAYRQQNPLTPLQQSVLSQQPLTAEQQQQQLSPEQLAAVQQQQSYIEQLQKQAQDALELAQSDPVAFAAQYRAQHPEGQPGDESVAIANSAPVATVALPPTHQAQPQAAGALTAFAQHDAAAQQQQQYYYPQQYQGQSQAAAAYPQTQQYTPYTSKKAKKAKKA